MGSHKKTIRIVGSYWISPRARLLLLAAICAVVAGGYLRYSHNGKRESSFGGTVQPPPKPGEKLSRPWYSQNLPLWESFEFGPLNDLPTVSETVTRWVESRHPGPAFDEAALVRDLSTFFFAFGASNPDEYLARLGGARSLIADPYSDANLHQLYRLLTGQPMYRELDSRKLLDLFWNKSAEPIGRPARLSKMAQLQVAYSKPLPAGEQPPGTRLSGLTYAHFSMFREKELEKWYGPASQGFPRVTEAMSLFDDVLTRDKRVLECQVFLPMQTTQDRTLIIGLLMFFDPKERTWHLEMFGSYHPDYVFWPF
jgi:hypothetical protein